MIENMEEYFKGLLQPRMELLIELEKEAEEKSIPITGPVVGGLLNMLIRISNAQKVLELGTATGYSAIFLGQALKKTGGKLITIENDEEMIRRAKEKASSQSSPKNGARLCDLCDS